MMMPRPVLLKESKAPVGYVYSLSVRGVALSRLDG